MAISEKSCKCPVHKDNISWFPLPPSKYQTLRSEMFELLTTSEPDVLKKKKKKNKEQKSRNFSVLLV